MAGILKPFKIALRGFAIPVGFNVILRVSCALASNKFLIASWLQRKR